MSTHQIITQISWFSIYSCEKAVPMLPPVFSSHSLRILLLDCRQSCVSSSLKRSAGRLLSYEPAPSLNSGDRQSLLLRLDFKHFFLIKLNVRTEWGILIFIPLLFICHYQMSLTFVISSLWFVLVSLCSCFFSTLSPHASANRSRWLAGSTGGLFLLKGVFSFLLLPSVAHRVSPYH